MIRKEELVDAIDGFTRLLADSQARFTAQLTERGLTARQLVYLDAIAAMHNPAPREMAEKLGLSKPSVSAIIRNFVKLGYVSKARSHEDARSYRIGLTARGKKLEELHERMHEDIAEIFMSKLDRTELELLVQLLKKAGG